MLKIFANHNKQDVVYSFVIGKNFPDIQGKLLRVEINGNELMMLFQKKEIPLCAVDTSYLIWHGRQAGRILKLLREVLIDDRR